MIYSSASQWTTTIGSGGIANDTVTTIPLSSTLGLTDGAYYIITVDRVDANGEKTPSKREVIAGQLSGSNLINCTRGVEGTAQAHSAGAVVEMLFTSAHWENLKSTVATLTGEETLTNKRITPRIVSITSDTAPTPNGDTTDVYIITALATNATFGAPTGTPTQGQKLIIRVKDDGTARTLSFNSIYRGIVDNLPSSTTASKTLYMGFSYNATDGKWDLIALAEE